MSGVFFIFERIIKSKDMVLIEKPCFVRELGKRFTPGETVDLDPKIEKRIIDAGMGKKSTAKKETKKKEPAPSKEETHLKKKGSSQKNVKGTRVTTK